VITSHQLGVAAQLTNNAVVLQRTISLTDRTANGNQLNLSVPQMSSKLINIVNLTDLVSVAASEVVSLGSDIDLLFVLVVSHLDFVARMKMAK
jgi:hypothetical protein